MFTAQELETLFRSVDWLSGDYPQELAQAMCGSGTVFSAWNGELLVVLINVLDDGALSAYIHYMLVAPEYQGRGIGSELLRRVREKYRSYLYLTVVPEERKNVAFYEKHGFSVEMGATPMVIFNPRRNI